MADNHAPDASRARRPRGVRARLVCGLAQSSGGNATAFGYSVTITASFGAVELGRGALRFGDLLLFGLGAVVAFGGLEGLATGGFRSPLEKGSDDVILLGTALAFVSIVVAIAAARGLAAVLSGAGHGLAPRSVPRWCSRWSRASSSCSPNDLADERLQHSGDLERVAGALKDHLVVGRETVTEHGSMPPWWCSPDRPIGPCRRQRSRSRRNRGGCPDR